MPESVEELAADSRWPAMFPSPMCFVTTADGSGTALERVVGASIVNRFPYVLAISLCREDVSMRHHARRTFCDILEGGECAAVQFLPRGAATDRALVVISSIPERHTRERVGASGLWTRDAVTANVPVFNDAYMVYEGRLARPGTDFEGRAIYDAPWIDVGSHRVYFLEVRAIQLRRDIARGKSKILWRSLPSWRPRLNAAGTRRATDKAPVRTDFTKGFSPSYEFPSADTVAYESDGQWKGMSVKLIPRSPAGQLEVDNDRARWPCFFPSPVGMITTWAREGVPDLMPCGSTCVVSRRPFVVAPCVAYAAINDRYKPRRTLQAIRRSGRFGCGVPYIDDTIVEAIRYAGTRSIDDDPDKLANAGLEVEGAEGTPLLSALPIHFDCRIVGEVRLGTHVMFLGEVDSIRVRADVTPENPIRWCPWPEVTDGRPSGASEQIVSERSLPRGEIAPATGDIGTDVKRRDARRMQAQPIQSE